MSDWGDESLDDWSRAAAAETGRRLDKCETEPFARPKGPEQIDQEEFEAVADVPEPSSKPLRTDEAADVSCLGASHLTSYTSADNDGGTSRFGDITAQSLSERSRLEEAEANDQIRPVPVVLAVTEPESSETAPSRGRWEVVTEASRYLLDLDRELLQRVRGTLKPSPEVAFPSKLRDHDRGWVRLLRIVHLEVGEPAVFDIESLGGPEVAFTRRTTTFVLSIRQLPEDELFVQASGPTG